LPFKDFAPGAVFTAADVDTYLMRQAMMIFASAAARTTALSGVLSEGMVVFLQDINQMQYYDGTAWVPFPGSELGYGALTANSTGYSALADITSVTTTFTAVASGEYLVEVELPSLVQNTSAGLVEARIESSGGTVYTRKFFDAAINQDFSMSPRARLTALSAGSFTVKARLSTSAGTVDVIAASTFPSYIHVIQL
jgi:hypothetical protein